MTLVDLHALPDGPVRAQIDRTLDDGRVIVRFRSGDLMTVPGHLVSPLHRAGDLAAAQAAADALPEVRLTDLQWRVLDALSRVWPDGLADHQHAAVNGLGQDTAGKRRLELQRRGLVVRHETATYTTPRGQTATVWQITATGRDVHARLATTRRLAHTV